MRKVLIAGPCARNTLLVEALRRQNWQPILMPDEWGECPDYDVEAVICNSVLMRHGPERFTNLRLVQLNSAGYDHVPKLLMEREDVTIYNAAGVYSDSMAEFAVCGILQLYKQAAFFAANQAAGRWEKHRSLRELSDKRVCIVGAGCYGRALAIRLRAFGCKVTGLNRTVRPMAEFDELLPLSDLAERAPKCDILALCIALTEQTRGIVSESVLNTLPSDAVVVNLARGPVVDEPALLRWLQANPNAGAVLDVFDTEPLPANHPLWQLPNAILTPHNSYVGEHNDERLRSLICKHFE